jgi:uncharacterized protein (DUF1800 family)
MDRRSFLKRTGGVAGALTFGSANVSTTLAAEPVNDKKLFASSGSGNRAKITSTLVPWTPSGSQPWDVHTIGHLYRRAGFGATISDVNSAKAKTPAEVIDSLLDDSLLSGANLPADPRYSDKWLHVPPYSDPDPLQQQNDYAYANMEIRRHWTVQMAKPSVMFRERMVLFWMNHFVVEAQKVYYPQLMYRYIDYFRRNAWGNFKQMVTDVTIQPAMLYYLDGIQNQSSTGYIPNENYARELMELFTLGVTDKDGNPNYSETDIRELAKALTGYKIDYTAAAPNVLPSKYDINTHDSTFKTIFGQKKQWGLGSAGVADDVISLLFDVRKDQLAWYICSKLYQYFVYHDTSGASERSIISAMAETFKANNWDIKPVLAELLKSEHFFDEANIGAQIKSPYDYSIAQLRSFDIFPDELQSGSLYYYNYALGQSLLDPPNVKGWPGYHGWISTTTLPYRNIALAGQLLISKSIQAVGVDGYGNPHTPINLPDANLTTWAKQFGSYTSDFTTFVGDLCNFLCAQSPSATAKAGVTANFPPNIYEWQNLTDTEKITPLRIMISRIMLLADYQLF